MFGDGAFRVVMKVRRGQKGGALNPSDQCPYRKRERQQREGHGEPREKAADVQPGRLASPGAKAAGSFTMDTRPPDWEKSTSAFKPHAGYFVMAAQAD